MTSLDLSCLLKALSPNTVTSAVRLQYRTLGRTKIFSPLQSILDSTATEVSV